MALVTNVIAKMGYHKVGLAWINPLTNFDHIRVLHKLGSEPTSDSDGIFVDYPFGDAAISVDFGTMGVGGYFLYEDTDTTTNVYWRVYVYVTAGDTAPEYVQKEAAPGASGTKMVGYAGSVLDSSSNPIVVGSDTWLVKAVNDRLDPNVAPGDLFYSLDSDAMTDSTFSISSLNNGVSPVTDYTDDIVWHGDTLSFEVWKNNNKEFTVSKPVNLYQAFNTYSLYPGGLNDPDLLSHLVLTAPANALPLAPIIVPGQPTTTSDTSPSFLWYHRADSDNPVGEIHYAVEIAQAQVNVGGNMQVDDTHASYKVYLSVDNPEYFEYTTDGGTGWTSFSTLGGAGLVLTEDNNHQIRFTIPDTVGERLDVAQWYWQIRATDKTPV